MSTTSSASLNQPRSPTSSSPPQANGNEYLLSPTTSFNVQLSLCGNLLGANEQDSATVFANHRVRRDQFFDSPQLVTDPNAIFMINGKYYPYAVAGPMLASIMLFQRMLPSDTIDRLVASSKEKETSSWKRWLGWGSSGPATRAAAASEHKHAYTRKSLRPTSAQLLSLNLKYGVNTITFSVTSTLQGTQTLSASIFLWLHSEQIIVSDIDGTITKSDVLGQLMPIVGKDWSQSGVAPFFKSISNNGYKFLYLTSRAIGQASQTREYISAVNQQGDTLPVAPICLSPDRLITSFTREVIRRKPQEFKIACLEDISALFPGRCPFYAGFGNRDTDSIAYQAVHIPQSRIFIINPRGEIRQPHIHSSIVRQSYTELHQLLDVMFPPTSRHKCGSFDSSSSFMYWSIPPPRIIAPPPKKK
eukprot:gnl/Spiro4/16897_TR9107_c0_g1_i1.p1 gnl/Spiro4/16897_TR9107_c0_g1~~gnl/Spiro4/16897_TR9107_c0_g1_i1.p1  ORF type:complete len:474 (+),score=124.42 gnl/Spiro4/16897_TR9107_c0_g1_i1:174-1424(+)